jgi:hypothetical protein
MEKLTKIRGTNKITDFIADTSPGTVLWIRRTVTNSTIPKTYLAVLEQYTKEMGHCTISKGPSDIEVLYLMDILEIAEVPAYNLVYAMNKILENSAPFE